MTSLREAYYEVAFKNRFIESTGDSFQDFFSTVMELRYPNGDFVRVRPWGRAGDQKNDGYLRSKRRLFQCYAPSAPTLSVWLAKIREDFDGALPHWKEYFDEWILAHNDRRGVPAEVLALLLKLSKENAPLIAKQWSYGDLLSEFKALSQSSVESLLGPAPGREDLVGVRVEDVRRLLEHVALQPEPRMVDVSPVPAEKLEYNQLSQAVATLLTAGMTRSELVGKYLRGLADQTKYDRLAQEFRSRYAELKGQGFAPDEIFTGLQRYIAGNATPSPRMQAATLAILAFFFEACEIFERPPATQLPA